MRKDMNGQKNGEAAKNKVKIPHRKEQMVRSFDKISYLLPKL